MVPIEVLAVRGPAQTARFSIALLMAGFLNFIPSTMGQVLFAEIARGGTPRGKQLRKALHGVYGLLLPSWPSCFTAPFVLRLFGEAYAAETTGCCACWPLARCRRVGRTWSTRSSSPGTGSRLIPLCRLRTLR